MAASLPPSSVSHKFELGPVHPLTSLPSHLNTAFTHHDAAEVDGLGAERALRINKQDDNAIGLLGFYCDRSLSLSLPKPA